MCISHVAVSLPTLSNTGQHVCTFFGGCFKPMTEEEGQKAENVWLHIDAERMLG